MGKNHRHAKKLKSEKNKVHIKTTKTKFLPKGQNVTDTSFKIRSIIIQEQLKNKDAASSLNKKKINVEESITRLRHYNDTIKVVSCQDLKDLIMEQPVEAIQKYFSSIIQNTSALVQDKDRKVRRASVKLLNAIFEKVSIITLRPYSTYILTNLKCAMTNINRNIQEDSLLLLDALLEHQKAVVAENFDGIFPNFLMLISKLKNQNSSERSLSLNLEGKITSVKWRVKVLSRLYGILNAIIVNRDDRNNQFQRSYNQKSVTVIAKGTNCIPLYRDISIYENVDFSLLSEQENGTKFDAHILNLVQLLHEIWIEAVPDKVSKKSIPDLTEPTILPNQESVAIFTCIVHILRLLHIYARSSKNSEVFSDKKSTLFLDQMIRNFPYTHNKKNFQEISKEFPSSFVFNCDQHNREENIIIIYIVINERLKNIRGNSNVRTIGPYLDTCLKYQNRLSSTSLTYLIKILKEILPNDPRLGRKLGIDATEMTESVANLYNNVKISGDDKSDILEILTSSPFQLWIQQLPNYLCSKKISAKLVETVLDLCKKGHEIVQDGVKKSLKLILGNLPVLEITETSNRQQTQMNLVSIFFYLSNLSNEDIAEIENFIKTHPDLAFVRYFRNVLELRSCFGK